MDGYKTCTHCLKSQPIITNFDDGKPKKDGTKTYLARCCEFLRPKRRKAGKRPDTPRRRSTREQSETRRSENRRDLVCLKAL